MRKRVYSVSMTEEELRLFSEFLNQKNYSSKLNEDEQEALQIMSFMTPKERERYRKENTKEKMYKKMVRESIKENGSAQDTLGAMGLVGGGGAGLALGLQNKMPYTGGVLGAAAGSVLGQGIGYVSDSYKTNKEVKRYKEDPNNPYYKPFNDFADQHNDLIDISEGKMTEDEYIAKWRPESKKKRKKGKK